MKFALSILLLTISSVASTAPDGSVELIQKWANDVQEAIKTGDKAVVRPFFQEGAIFMTCEHNSSDSHSPFKNKVWHDENVVNLFAKNNPELSIHVLSSKFASREFEDFTQRITAFLVITGFGDPIAHPKFYFHSRNGTVQYYHGESIPCGRASMNCRNDCE